ncbi:MAG TPA: neutral/alkaline non-lysosomal ceramidase N-terminal domain-containing protein [Solirubrobacteraceae bacterium]|nr:neutral/alkaline non-lysosomal ceramidase N-terminal domain-containing protein [Solirubrobacteraceae bacterium]
MKSLRVCLLVAVAALGCVPATALGELRAGAARADITPPIGTPMFAYTARSAIAGAHVDRPMQIVADPDHRHYAKTFVPSTGVHTRVQARAIVLEQDGEKYALVQADLGGVPYAMTQEVAKRIRSTGITTDRILLAATHTHSSTGPIWPADNNGYGALGGDLFDPRIFQITSVGIAEAIIAADKRLQAARLGVGHTTVTDASRNRNFVPFRRNQDVPQDEAGARAVSIDPALTVIRVDDTNGKPIAVWSNFAIHETSFGDSNLLFSGDNAAFTERIVEGELSKVAGRDVVNVWTNGNEGDISPNGSPTIVGGEPAEHVNSSFGSAHMAGKRVADGVLRAWREAESRMTSTPALGARRSFVAFDGSSHDGRPVGPIAALGQGGIVADDGECAPVEDMAGPGQGRKLPALIGAGLVPSIVPISLWNVDGLGVAALPAEITKQMGERIRTALDRGGYSRVALAGLTNAYISYTATPEEYDACHYEGSFTLYGRHMGLRWMDEILKLSAPLLAGRPAPTGAPEPPNLGFPLQHTGIPARQTPDAGTIVEEPATTVARTGRVTFRWNGGDPGIDLRRGRAFVTVERLVNGQWRTAFTDDSYQDTTERTGRDVWTEIVQFTECDPLGSYRITVDGLADKGDGVKPYRVVSRAFELTRVGLQAGTPTVDGETARVRVRYPAPAAGSLLAVPRLVRTGTATLRVTAPDGTVQTRTAAPADDGSFAASVPAGSSVELVSAQDGCGNSA